MPSRRGPGVSLHVSLSLAFFWWIGCIVEDGINGHLAPVFDTWVRGWAPGRSPGLLTGVELSAEHGTNYKNKNGEWMGRRVPVVYLSPVALDVEGLHGLQ